MNLIKAEKTEKSAMLLEFSVDKETFASKSKNTPFHGRKVHGRVVATIVDGTVVYQY